MAQGKSLLRQEISEITAAISSGRRSVIGAARIRRSRPRGKLFEFGSDGGEGTEGMLLQAETVRIRAVGRIYRLLEPNRKILIQVGFLRPALANNVRRDVVCVVVAEH